MDWLYGKIGVLIRTLILLLVVFVVGCSRPSRDNDKFLSRVPSELKEHYKFIDTYRAMYPNKLDSVIQLFDNRYDRDSSSVESAYYNLAFAYNEYSKEHNQEVLYRLFLAENAVEGRGYLALEAEIKLLAGLVYRNLVLNQFSKKYLKDAYNYFREGDYPNQTLLAALNLAWIEISDPRTESSSNIDSYIDLCDSIFINHHDRVRYANYYHYKYLVDKSNINYLDSVLSFIDIREEPSINLEKLYNMNLNLLMVSNDKNEIVKARVVLDRMNDIYKDLGDTCRSRLRSLHLFEESIVLAREGHHELALNAYREGVKFRNVTSNIRIDVNRYRALYKIYYTAGYKEESDSALICNKKAYDRVIYKQQDDGVSSLLKYKYYAKIKNDNILNENKFHTKLQIILVVIGLILIIYIISLYRENRKIYKESLLEYNPDDEYIEYLEDKIQEFDRRIMVLERDIELEMALESIEDDDEDVEYNCLDKY